MAFPGSDLQASVSAYLGADPTAAPGTWPAATDLSDRLTDTPIRITHGRASGQRTAGSCSATLEMHNTDGALTPLNPTSAYYGTWDLGVPVALDVTGVGSSPPYGRLRGYVASVDPIIRPGAGGKDWSTVKVTLGGVLRQLGMGKRALKSALYRYFATHPNLVAYFPLDEPAPATQWREVLSDGRMIIGSPLLSSNASAGADPLLPWLDPAVRLQGSANLKWFRGAPVTTGGALTVAWVSAFADRNSGVAVIINDGTFANYGNVFYGREDAVGAAGHLYVNTVDTGDAPEITARGESSLLWIVHLDNSGGSLLYTVSVYDDAGEQVFTRSGTALGGSGPMTNVGSVRWESPFPDGVATMSSLAVIDANVTDDDIIAAFRGYWDELAGDRFDRLCTEEAVPFTTAAGTGRNLGPQPVGLDIVGHLRDIEQADHGLLYELVDDWGFGYRSLRGRYALTPSMTVDLSTYAAEDPSNLLLPVRDDSRMRNEWAVGRVNGSEATIVDAAHQAKHGRYEDSLTVNVASDSVLPDEASWRVHEGTFEGWRYKSPTLDLASNPTLLAEWLELGPGDRFDITALPDYHSPDDAQLVCEGYTETLGRRSWEAQPVGEPYPPYNVAVYGPDPGGIVSRYGHPGSRLTIGINSSVGSFAVTNDPNPTISWGTDTPYDITVGGERMTVTGVSGHGASQTLTVTRSVNGVVKSHLANAVVQLAELSYYGL